MLDFGFLSEQVFWMAVTAVVAAAALIVSLFGPVRRRFEHIELNLYIRDHMYVTHFLGNTTLTILLDLYNSGSKTATVTDLISMVERVGIPERGRRRRYWYLPAQSVPGVAAQGQFAPQYLFNVLVIASGQQWGQWVHFYSPLTGEDEDRSQDVVSALRENISAKIQANLAQGVPSNLAVHADDVVMDQARKMVEEFLDFEPGQYHLYIVAIDPTGELLALRGYSFVLDNVDIKILRESVDYYKYGWGLFVPDPPGIRNGVSIRLAALPNQNEIETEYKNALVGYKRDVQSRELEVRRRI